MEKFLGKGYHLYTDSFYNSFELTKHKINQKTYICGTLRPKVKSKRVYKSKTETGRRYKQKQRGCSDC